MKVFNRATGIIAEDYAALDLSKKGYQLVKRNFSTRFGEIDIIAKDKDIFVFVEVKAKTGINFGYPEEMINQRKLAKVKRMAEVYLDGKSVPCRIDVIAIILDRDRNLLRLTHYQNVY